jgi:hypothetical protein
MGNITSVSVPTILPSAVGSRAIRTVFEGAAMIAASDSSVRGGAEVDSWGSRRANASTSSDVAAPAVSTSTVEAGFVIRISSHSVVNFKQIPYRYRERCVSYRNREMIFQSGDNAMSILASCSGMSIWAYPDRLVRERQNRVWHSTRHRAKENSPLPFR